MHVCIVGTGAAGWIACNYLKHIDFIDKITIIGSSKIPSIGVGESTTLLMQDFLDDLSDLEGFSFNDFIKNTDAAIKYGVMYKNWSKKDFLHYFKDSQEFSDFNETYSLDFYGRILANKDPKTHIHDLMGKNIFKEAKNNNLVFNNPNFNATPHVHAYHFDAGMFIDFMSSIAIKNTKVNFIDDIVLGGEKNNDDIVSIKTKGGEIFADFYIFATGDKKINTDFLDIKYSDLSNILLTNKALFYPLKYKNKKKEFHPYTVAKTMKNGWRWITPTWSRIGTGYVFSDKYTDVDSAIREFQEDIGDFSIEPNIVDFHPRTNKNQIHNNWCTIGMASGFLEPLDAPGLHLTISSLFNQIHYYLDYLKYSKNHNSKEKNISEIEKINEKINTHTDFWTMFIFSQYKTCIRSDTDFWKDHKNVYWEKYERFIDNLDEHNTFFEKMMIQQTMASKDVQWKTSLNSKPYKTKSIEYITKNHYDYIKEINKSQ
jgi:hypothetical protein